VEGEKILGTQHGERLSKTKKKAARAERQARSPRKWARGGALRKSIASSQSSPGGDHRSENKGSVPRREAGEEALQGTYAAAPKKGTQCQEMPSNGENPPSLCGTREPRGGRKRTSTLNRKKRRVPSLQAMKVRVKFRGNAFRKKGEKNRHE